MLFKNLCVLVLWVKVASALEGLKKKKNEPKHEIVPFKYTMAFTNKHTC